MMDYYLAGAIGAIVYAVGSNLLSWWWRRQSGKREDRALEAVIALAFRDYENFVRPVDLPELTSAEERALAAVDVKALLVRKTKPADSDTREPPS